MEVIKKIPVGSVIAGKYSYWSFHLCSLMKSPNERNALAASLITIGEDT